MLCTATTLKYAFDYKSCDGSWCTADYGRIIGHNYFAYGSTVILYEGVPNYADPGRGRCWDILDKNKVIIFFTAPTLIRLMRESREIAMTAAIRRIYVYLFDRLYPPHTLILLKGISQEVDRPKVTTPFLKFKVGLDSNKVQDIYALKYKEIWIALCGIVLLKDDGNPWNFCRQTLNWISIYEQNFSDELVMDQDMFHFFPP